MVDGGFLGFDGDLLDGGFFGFDGDLLDGGFFGGGQWLIWLRQQVTHNW